METYKKEATTLNPSVGADGGQSLKTKSITILAEKTLDDKSAEAEFQEKMRKMQQMQNPNYLHTITLNELYDTVFVQHPPIIEDILYPGTYLFVGAPKVGKSFLMAQLAYHVSMGIPFWNKPVQQGTVLYLALEDPYFRIQHRLSTMFDVEGTDNLHFACASKQVGLGLEDQLETFLKNHPDTNLVIIDTLKKVRESGKESSYDKDYDFVEPIKKIGDAHKICILVVHHTRKQDASDAMEKISGTNGLSGAADGAFVMYKPKRLEATAMLEVYGRDQPDQKITLRRDMERLCWNWESAEVEEFQEKPDPVILALDGFMSPEVMDWTGTATDLAEALGLSIKPNKLTMKLNVNSSRLKNDYRIHYECTRNRSGRTITLHREPPPIARCLSLERDGERLYRQGMRDCVGVLKELGVIG